jgi:hypothetical protein
VGVLCPQSGPVLTELTPTNAKEIAMQHPLVSVTIELPADQARAFAEFLKRADFSDFRQLAADDAEAYDMQAAGEAIRQELARAGIAPR